MSLPFISSLSAQKKNPKSEYSCRDPLQRFLFPSSLLITFLRPLIIPAPASTEGPGSLLPRDAGGEGPGCNGVSLFPPAQGPNSVTFRNPTIQGTQQSQCQLFSFYCHQLGVCWDKRGSKAPSISPSRR